MRDPRPTYVFYPRHNMPMTPELSSGDGIHHPKFGQVLKVKMDELGVPCTIRFREDLPDLDTDVFKERSFGELVEFITPYLQIGA